MRQNFAKALSCVSACCNALFESILTDGTVHGTGSNILACWIESRCKDLARMACQLHDWRLQGASLSLASVSPSSCSAAAQAVQKPKNLTYRLHQCAILPCSARYRNRGAVEVRVRLCALDQLVRAECIVGRAFCLGHFDRCALFRGFGGTCGRCYDMTTVYG